MSNSADIKFNLDYYTPQKPGDNIYVLAYKYCDCQELIVSVDLDDLIIGQTYTINYSSINSTAVFAPATQTIRAASNSQKFSTIMYIDPAKTHIVKAEITGINIVASQMCVIKCGSLNSCEINDTSNIVLNKYNNWEYKVDQLPVFKFVPSSNEYNDITISVDNLPYVSSRIPLLASVSPLINTSSNITIGLTVVGTLIYLSNFDNQHMVLSYNDQNYNISISQGVLTVT